MNYLNGKRLILILLTIIFSGMLFTKNVYAYWEKNENDWRYIGDSGYEKKWQEINGKWYYFSNETGVMKIGWFYDEQYNKWYYFTYNGDMDDSKTTATYPTELSSIQEKIKQYAEDDATYEVTKQVDNAIYVCFISKNESSSVQYYYQPSTGNIYEVKDGILTNLATNEKIDSFTQDQAIQVVQDYLKDNYKYVPKIIKVVVDDGDSYFVHCYDTEGDAANSSWYHVNKTTREVTLA